MSEKPINEHISFDEIIANYPSFHRRPDGTPWFLGISGQALKAFAELIKPGMRTIETGAGFSTLAFIVQGAHHTAICPDDYLEANIRGWCDEWTIDHSRFTFVCEKSQDVVPRLEGQFDFAFVDGEHAFPMPMIDFYYLARRLRPGGIMVIDDTNIWTGDVIAKHLMLDVDWEFVSEHDEKTSIFRLKNPYQDKGMWNQPYTLANSKRLPIEFYDGLRR